MPNYRRIFVLENGKYVIIRNEEGNEVAFSSIEDLNRCSGMDFTSKFHIGYEPEIEHFIDSEDPTVDPTKIPDVNYEWLINNIDILISRRDNPLYGLTGLKLWETERLIRSQNIRQTFIIDSEAPVEVTIPEGTFTFNGGWTSASHIQGAIQLSQALNETNIIITDVKNIPIEMSIESANIVASTIGHAFRTAFFAKQNALVAMDNETFTE